MVGTLADKVSGLLDPRFRLTVWLPTVVFAISIGAVAVLGVGWANSVAWWRSAGTEGQIALTILAFGAVTLLAFLIYARLMSFLQFFEGYWDELPFGEGLANRRKAHYRAKLARLATAAAGRDAEAQRAQAKMYYWYPPRDTPEQVMPTRLGNVLRASEVHPWLRYSIDGAIVWPRLYGLLPDSFVESLGQAKSQMDLMAVWAALSFAFAIVGGGLAAFLLPFYAGAACAWGGALSAALSYHALVRNAIPYSELVKSAFDVHRYAILDALGWKHPPDLDAENAQWTAITQLWYQVTPSNPEALGYPGSVGQPRPDTVLTTVPPAAEPLEHLWRWLIAAAAVLGLVWTGIAAVSNAPEPSRFIVAATALPQYHQSMSSDLKQRAHGKTAPAGTFKSIDQVAGRYTLRAVAAGEPMLSSDLGPQLEPNRLMGDTAVDLGPGGGRFPSTLQRGDEVDVFVRPHPVSRAGSFEIDDALVLDVRRSPGAIVIAVPAARETAMANAVVSGVVVVIKENQ